MEKSNVTEAEYADALEEEHLDGQFVQKFLRAIIECYPSPNARPKSLAQRIDAAQEALFGKVLVVGRDTGDDEDALRFMADEFVRDRKGPAISIGPNPFAWLAANPREARSIVDLAREAKGRFPKSSSAKSWSSSCCSDPSFPEARCRSIVSGSPFLFCHLSPP